MGHTTTVTLMKARGADTSALAPVWDNSVQWGNFMGVSSNLRYQLVVRHRQSLYHSAAFTHESWFKF